MLVLALDTSTPAITAGVVELLLPHQMTPPHQLTPHPVTPHPGTQQDSDAGLQDPVRLLAEDVAVDPFGHAEKLLPLIIAALTSAGRSLAELDAVVVGLGPGPFTGLRVGIVTAASLGDALGVPVHGVPSHDGLARSVPARNAPARSTPAPAPAPSVDGTPALLVVTDARRREVYLSGYAPGGRRVFGPAVLAPAAVDPSAILGSAAQDGFRVVGAGIGLVPVLEQQQLADPGSLSRGLVLAAGRELVTGAIPGPLVPLYLRRPDVAEPSAPKSTLNAAATLNAQIGGRR
ncbi:MAG: tRNA (adenosine(37)-N6)-threonylcarbamoyltransferase complex dimerization subunit type 1 TsaB [Nakamurella sp.]